MIKRFKTCMGCPFLHMGGCSAVPRDRETYRHPDVGRPQARGHRPPAWCPLRKGPITLSLLDDNGAHVDERGHGAA